MNYGCQDLVDEITQFILSDISLVNKLLSLLFLSLSLILVLPQNFITILSLPPHLYLYLCLFLVSPKDFVTISIAPNVTLNRGDDITLICNTTAGPDNVIIWIRQGDKVIRQDTTVEGKYHLCFI